MNVRETVCVFGSASRDAVRVRGEGIRREFVKQGWAGPAVDIAAAALRTSRNGVICAAVMGSDRSARNAVNELAEELPGAAIWPLRISRETRHTKEACEALYQPLRLMDPQPIDCGMLEGGILPLLRRMPRGTLAIAGFTAAELAALLAICGHCRELDIKVVARVNAAQIAGNRAQSLELCKQADAVMIGAGEIHALAGCPTTIKTAEVLDALAGQIGGRTTLWLTGVQSTLMVRCPVAGTWLHPGFQTKSAPPVTRFGAALGMLAVGRDMRLPVSDQLRLIAGAMAAHTDGVDFKNIRDLGAYIARTPIPDGKQVRMLRPPKVAKAPTTVALPARAKAPLTNRPITRRTALSWLVTLAGGFLMMVVEAITGMPRKD